jgi:hypothetical protein
MVKAHLNAIGYCTFGCDDPDPFDLVHLLRCEGAVPNPNPLASFAAQLVVDGDGDVDLARVDIAQVPEAECRFV